MYRGEKREVRREENQGSVLFNLVNSNYLYSPEHSAYMLVVQGTNIPKSSAHRTTLLKCVSGRPIHLMVVRGTAQLNSLYA